jgi:hypothetical protein
MTMLTDAPFTAKGKAKIAAEAFFAALEELEHAEKRAARYGYNLTTIARRSGLARETVSKIWVFVKSCGWILPQNEGEMPVDSGFMCLGRCSEFARESEMIPSDNGLRCRGADAGHFNEATAFA